MNDNNKSTRRSARMPLATVHKVRHHLPVVWVVPLLAATVAGYLVYDNIRELGPAIEIKFKDGSGVKPGQTPVQYRGVRIGEVKSVELSDDLQHVVVQARLAHSAAAVAREGSVFWIVRLSGGLDNLTGLGTVITGPHIEVLPGNGARRSEFVGQESSPVAVESDGLNIVLRADSIRSLRPGSPVFYRDVEVGVVQAIELNATATAVHVRAVIRQRYAPLVRNGSKFWSVSGSDVKFGLFSGLKLSMQSLKSFVVGGVAFATPPEVKPKPLKEGALFRLYEEPKKDWLAWRPEIPIAPE